MMSQGARRAALLLVMSIAWAPLRGAAVAPDGRPLHEGVATCAGSNCHGAERPFADSNVLQNEYFTWARKDAHHNAYKLLLKPEAERIAANLGLKKASEAPECLTCHTDYVPANGHGRRYDVADGVGCEACHGGAQNWLGPHVSDYTHKQNVDAGLAPLEDPVVRGKLCLQCHLGTDSKPITHRIMGAGHPPLEFELDSFTYIQPNHFRISPKYKKRKVYSSDAKVWAIGQLVAAQMFLDGLGGERFGSRGTFPDLIFFDCNACHHSPLAPRWVPGIGGPLGPGEPRLADGYLVMTGHVFAVLDPPLAEKWQGALADLHRAASQSIPKAKEVATQLRALTETGLNDLRGHDISKAEAFALLDRICASGIERDYGDSTTSKQIAYAAQALAAFLEQDAGVSTQAMKKPIDGVVSAWDAQNNYAPETFRAALRSLREAARRPAN
jgi:hypothetical protein